MHFANAFNTQIAKKCLTSALDEPVPYEPGLALAGVVRRQVAALCVLDAPGGLLRYLALVDVPAGGAVALVPLVAGAEVSPERVGAVAEDVAGPVLALVGVRHVAALAAVPVVAVALRPQASAVLAGAPSRVQAVILKKIRIFIIKLPARKKNNFILILFYFWNSNSLVHLISGLDSSEPW